MSIGRPVAEISPFKIRHDKFHDVITDDIRSGATIREDHSLTLIYENISVLRQELPVKKHFLNADRQTDRTTCRQ